MPIVVRRKTGDNDVVLLADWDQDGDFYGPFEDLTDDLRALSCERGLSPAFGTIVAGQLSAELDNRSNVYNPDGPNTALKQHLHPYVPFQLKVSTRQLLLTNGALRFDGTGAKVVADLGVGWPQANWTVEFWFRWAGSTSVPFRHVFGVGAGATHFLSVYVVTAISQLHFKTTIASVVYDALGKIQIKPNVWYHAALSYDGATLRSYLNGRLTEARAASGTVDNADDKMVIGSNADGINSTVFDGDVDDFRLWKVARSPEAILADMIYEVAGSHPDLLGYWKLNEGTGTIAQDATGLYPAYFQGGPTWTTGCPEIVRDVEDVLMTGILQSYRVVKPRGDAPSITVLTGTDAFSLLGAEVRIPTAQNVNTATLAGTILDDAGIVAAKRVIDVGSGDVIPIVFGERRSARAWLDALALFGYSQFIDKDGRYVLKGRTGQAGAVRVGTLTRISDLAIESDDESLVTRVRVVAHPWKVGTIDVILWLSGLVPFELVAGQDVLIVAAFADQTTGSPIGSTAVVTPVATTDYLAEDLSAVDKTSFLTVTLEGGPSSTINVRVKNTYSATVRVTKLQVRGKAVTPLNVETVDISTGVAGLPDLFREVDSELIQTRPLAEIVAGYLASKFGAPRMRYLLEWTDIDPWDAVALAADVFDEIVVDEPGGFVPKLALQVRGMRFGFDGTVMHLAFHAERLGILADIPLLESWDHIL